MKVLYIGPYSDGSTCRMRGEIIKNLLNADNFIVIDTEKILNGFNKVYKSVAFRYKIGPVIKAINDAIKEKLENEFDLIWVDKAIFITKQTTKKLKEKTGKLVHFTPDPAFLYHKSKHFINSLSYYDNCITTKSYEENLYEKYSCKNLIIASQGFDKNIHKPYHQFEEKSGIVFIGHYEPNRAVLIKKLLELNIDVKIAGIKWKRFSKQNANHPRLKFLGEGIFGESYAKTISSSMFGLGLLSKFVPDLHTTRTFEIPACRTILFTEKNEETSKFFNNDEVVFYDDFNELINKLKILLVDKQKLKELSEKGYWAVISGGYDYESIMKKLLHDIEVL